MEVFDSPQEKDTVDIEYFQGEKRKLIQPTSMQDPKLLMLKEDLVDWINSSLKQEHIVVQSLEEDLFDGLVIHHLLTKLAGVQLPVDEIAVTSTAQIRKLEIILEALNERLGLEDGSTKWSVKLIHNKDLLATLHLLVAMAKCFQPDLDLPPSVSVEVILVEVNKNGIKSDKQMEILTGRNSTDTQNSSNREHPIDQLLQLDPHKVLTVKTAILHFVNQKMSTMGLQVTDLEKQFADGVILLLLIGQLEGFFIPLYDFHLTPVSGAEMLHNVTLALDLLNDSAPEVSNVDPQDIISQDASATLKVLYALFKRHKARG